ncbi:MAG: hypothetical protein IPI52_08420 [Bacteroidetes bacterium]|nr:hypothetical protein [Bacteroidota bacterium]
MIVYIDNVSWFNNDIAFVRKDMVGVVKDKNSLYTIIDKFGGLLKTPLNMSSHMVGIYPNISSIEISGEIRYYDEINKNLQII